MMRRAKTLEDALNEVSRILQTNPKSFKTKEGKRLRVEDGIKAVFNTDNKENIKVVLGHKSPNAIAIHPMYQDVFINASGYDENERYLNFHGFHRTALDKSGNITAEQKEICLATGINIFAGMDEEPAFLYATQGNGKNINLILNFFNNHKDNIMSLVKQMNLPKGAKAYKCPSIQVLPEYATRRINAKSAPSKTPKTDLCIVDKNNNLLQRLSLKQGWGQASSSNSADFFATIISIGIPDIIQDLFNELIAQPIIDIKGITRSEQKKTDPATYDLITEQFYKDSMIILKMCDTAPEWKRELIIEQYTGQKKFGDESIGTADTILSFSEQFALIDYCTIEEYVDKYIDKIQIMAGNKCSSSNPKIEKHYRCVHGTRVDQKQMKRAA